MGGASLLVLTPRQLEILRHALGVDQYGRGEMYRRHFCAGGDDETVCRELVALGFMETFVRSWLPYYNCIVTEAANLPSLLPHASQVCQGCCIKTGGLR